MADDKVFVAGRHDERTPWPPPAEARKTIREIIGSYDDLVTRLYAIIRFSILRQPFLEEIGQYLPREGRILDLGCGFGLFSLYFAALEPRRQILGVDLSSRRIDRARASARKLGLENVRYEASDVRDWRSEAEFDAVYFLDLVHHLPRDSVSSFLAKAISLVRPGGMVVVKDVADRPYLKMLFTLALDRLMVGLEPIYYWPPDELSGTLRRLDLDVVRHRMTDILPYPHILYVGRMRDQLRKSERR